MKHGPFNYPLGDVQNRDFQSSFLIYYFYIKGMRIESFSFAIFTGVLACCCPCVLAFWTQGKLNDSRVFNLHLRQKLAEEEPIPSINRLLTSVLTLFFPCVGIALLRQQARERYQFAVSLFFFDYKQLNIL